MNRPTSPNPSLVRVLRLVTVVFMLVAAAGFVGCSNTLSQGRISSADIEALQGFPHATFDDIVQQHVDGEGRADYTALAADTAKLESFTSTVASVGPNSLKSLFASGDDVLAYYINAYNSLAMLNVLSRYPNLKTLADITSEFFYFTNVQVDGEETNLYDLENSIIRPYARTYYTNNGQGSKLGRVHFGLNCASASCPKLPSEAFFPDKLEEQLERETRKFVLEERNVTVNKTGKKVTLSRIFDWYSDDFTDDKGKKINQLKWINKYRPEDQQLDTSFTIAFHEYDWTLNDQKLYGGPAPKAEKAPEPAPENSATSAPAETKPSDTAPAAAPASEPAPKP